MSEELEVARYALRTFRLFTNPTLNMDFNWREWLECPDLLLGPVGVNEPHAWKDGTIQAHCIRRYAIPATVAAWGGPWETVVKTHDTPALDCTCGAYGSLSLNHLTRQYPQAAKEIVAVIAAEGNTIIGTRGLRTQYARVVAYWAGESEYLSVAQRQFKDAKQYEDLEQMVKDFGLPIEHQVEETNFSSMSEWWTGGE